MKRCTIALICLAVMLSGCATSKMDYVEPQVIRVENTKVVNQPFDLVWDKLVRNLSSDFFVINNIDKNSRLINISFSSHKPSEFVDCGRSNRSFQNARGSENYSYATADSAAFSSTNPQGHAFNVKRTTKLEGRSNIYVAPEGSGTSIVVNTKYVISVVISATGFDGRPGGIETATFDLSTKQPFVSPVTCYANGRVERKILDFVGK